MKAAPVRTLTLDRPGFSLAPAAGEPRRLPPPPEGAVEALRQRLAGTTAREHVVLDFLEEDLLETRAALAAVVAYVANVERALRADLPDPAELIALARAVDPAAQAEELQAALANVRRRLAQVAARM
jgi:hypothetical protein